MPGKLALFGLSFGGVLAPIAASREHRISAVVCIDGLNNLTAAIANELPPQIVELYESGNKSYAAFPPLQLRTSG